MKKILILLLSSTATFAANPVLENFDLNARSYGARGVGGLETIPLQAAVHAANLQGKSLFVPAGRYLISSPLRITNGIASVRGSGKNTVFVLAGGTNMFTADPGPSNFYGTWFSDFSIEMGFVTNATGIYFASGGQTCGANNIWITDLGANSIGIATADHNSVNNIKLQNIRIATTSGGSSTGFQIGADSSTLIDCEYSGGTLGGSTGYGVYLPTTLTSFNMIGGELAYAKYGVYSPGIIGGPSSALFAGVRMEGNTDYGYWIVGFDNTANRSRGITILNPYITGGTTNGIYANGIESLNILGGTYKDIPTNGACITLGQYVTGLITQGGLIDCAGEFVTGVGTNSPGVAILGTNTFGASSYRSPVIIYGSDAIGDLRHVGGNFRIKTDSGLIILDGGVLGTDEAIFGSASVPDVNAEPITVRGGIRSDNPDIAGGRVNIVGSMQVNGYTYSIGGYHTGTDVAGIGGILTNVVPGVVTNRLTFEDGLLTTITVIP